MIPTKNLLLDVYLDPILKQRYCYKFETLTIDFSTKRKTEKLCTRDITITFLGKIKELFAFSVFTRKASFTRDGFTIDERLLSKRHYAFGDTMIGVTEKGEIVKMFNLKEMQEEWEDTKHQLRKDYRGSEFEIFLEDITAVLASEEKTVNYLKSKEMLGLYFYGLLGKNDDQKVPLKRKEKVAGFYKTHITEEIWTDNKKPKFIITAEKSDEIPEKIISTGDELKTYQGSLYYSDENQLLEGFLEVENKSKKIIHNVVWLG